MLFGAVGCTPDEPVDDLTKASISVTPTQEAFTLAGGSVTIEVTSNCAWKATTDADVTISPASGNGKATVTIEVPKSSVDRNIFIKFTASRVGSVGGTPYPTDDDVEVTLFQNEKGEAKYATNVKQVRAALKAVTDATVLPTEIAGMTLMGVVVGEPNGNMNNNYLLTIQDNSTEAGAGLTLSCANDVRGLQIGQTVAVDLLGAEINYYNELLQLKVYGEIRALGELVEVSPIDVTLANIMDYESQYVRLSNVRPAAAGETWVKNNSATSVTFYSENFEEFIVRCGKYASFGDEAIPACKGSISGVVSRSKAKLWLMPQYLTDINLTEPVNLETQTVTIADITVPGNYKVENAWVVGFTGNGVILTDSSNAFVNVYIYENKNKTIGQKMTVEGVANGHEGGFQFYDPKVTLGNGVVEVTYPTPTSYTEATAVEQLAAKFGGEGAPYLAEYAEFSGVVNYDGSYYNLLFAGVDVNNIKGSLTKTPNEALNLQALNGKPVKIRGFVTDYDSQYMSIVPVSVELDSSVVSLSAENVQFIPQAGVENATTKIVCSGLAQGDISVAYDGVVVTYASVDVENGKLTYTVDANSGEAREGSVTLSVTGMADVVVKFGQLGIETVVSTIADLWAGTVGAEYTVLGAQAVAVANNQVILADNSGKLIALYKPSTVPAIGDYVSVCGATSVYNGLLQISNATVVVNSHSDDLIAVELESLTASEIDALVAAAGKADYAPHYVEYSGILSISGSYYNVEIPGATTAMGSLKTSNDVSADVIKSFANKPIKVKGYFYGVSSSKYLNTSVVTIEEDTTIKMLKANDIAGVPAAGVTDATATIVVANLGAVTATYDGEVVKNASVDGNVLTYTVSPNTTTEPREGSITLSAEGVESVTIKVLQLVADNSTYAMIDKIANLAAGDYYMAAYCESYNNVHFEANPYHLCTGAKITTANSNADLYTTPYSYSDTGKLSPITGAENFAKIVTLVAVEGKENTYYVMLDGKYVYSYTANTNRRISLTDTPTEWVASDHKEGGVVLSSNQVNLGSAGAQSDVIRSYKDASIGSLKYGLYFFKKN